MPLQNRVLPGGGIVVHPARGTMMGNRGILHDHRQRLGVARWRHKNWVCCLLSYKGRKRELMAPDRYTELFFLDEAVALAAGHRPCAECRRADFHAFQDAWPTDAGGKPPRAAQIDTQLHAARVTRNQHHITYQAPLSDLPDGAFVQHGNAAYLVQGKHLRPYRPDGYGAAIERGMETIVSVLTPKPTIAALQAGYTPMLHPSADPAKTRFP